MGFEGMGRHRSTAARRRLAAAALASLCLLSGAASAQEIGQVWVSDFAFNGPHATERAVQQDMESLHAPSLPYGPFSFEVTKQTVLDDRTIYQYEFERVPPVVGEWSHHNLVDPPQPNATLQTVVDQITQRLDAQSTGQGCPASTVVTVSPNWQVHSSWDNGQAINESTAYVASYATGSPGNCASANENGSILRNRTIQCPNITVHAWSAAKQACAGVPGSEMTYASAPIRTCPAEENCQTSSGTLAETTNDFDLGWVSFQRSYHSGGSAASGGFGGGWTNSHNIRLTIGTNPASGNSTLHYGLVDADGRHTAFKPVGAAYEASDGSGDRLMASGVSWIVHRDDRSLSFDAEGRLLQQSYENGSALSYSYDSLHRLSTITHSNGRVLEFAYASGKGGAPIASISSAGAVLVSYTYTSLGQVETATYADGGQRRYHYGDSQVPMLLVGVTAEDNRRLSTNVYDEKARVQSRVLGDTNNVLTMTYGATGTANAKNGLDRQNVYTLTATPLSGAPRKVASVANSAGTLSTTYYPETTDFRRRVDTVTDRNGTVTKHQYAELTDTVSGLPVRAHTVIEAQGTAQARTTEQRHELATNRVLMTLVGNRETRVVRNARQQPTSVAVRDTVSNATRTTAYAYCEAADVAASNSTCPLLGLLKSVDGPRTDVSDIITYAYYPSDHANCASTPASCLYRKGDLWKAINALGQVAEVLGYDAQGRVLSVKDANGVVTDYDYHPRGWLTAVKVRGPNAASEADDRITSAIYEPTGMVQRLTQPDGSYVTFIYDAAQRLTDVTDNAGNTIHYTLDAAGNRTKEETKDASATLRRQLSRGYNSLGEQTQHKDASNQITGTTYDADGNPNVVTDPLSRVIDHDFDPLNRVSRTVQDPAGIAAETLYQYDALDNVTQVTDPKGLNTTYVYNGFGEVTQLTSPDTGVTQYGYDSAGNLSSRLDANDTQPRTYLYDALNRLTWLSDSATGPGNSYVYDTVHAFCSAGETFAQGRLTSVTGRNGRPALYCYDRFGQVVRKRQMLTSSTSLNLRYAYTLAGQLQAITYPDGSVVDYVRDAQGRISEVAVTAGGEEGQNPLAGVRTVVLTQAAYLPFGPVRGWNYGSGRSLLRDHDLDYRPKTILDGASGGLSLHYGYDAAGQLTELKDGLQSAFLARYDYDNLGRLTVLRDGPTSTPIETYTYDATGNRTSLLHGITTTSFTYPSTSHRLTSVGGQARTYDGAGSTISVDSGAKEYDYGDLDRLTQVRQGSTVLRSYQYNGLGERVKATHPVTSASTHTVYDESGQWLGDYNDNGQPLQQVIWMDSLPVGLLAGADATLKLHYIEPDHLSTPRAVIDSSRNLAIWSWALQGEAFGNSAPNQDPDLDSTAFVFDMRFPGQRYDAATGLNYNYFRDYDPRSGRYVQSDPIGLQGGVSTFGYVASNPLSSIDPLGLISSNARALLMLAKGDITQAAFYAQAMGLAMAPRLQQLSNGMQALTSRYPLASNQCEKVAKGIFDLLKANKLNPQYLRLAPTQTRWMYVGNTSYVAPQHFAVRLGDRVFDASTGPAGMLYKDYVAMLTRVNGGSGAYIIQTLDNIDNFL